MMQYSMDALIICIFKGMHWKRYRSWLIPLLIVTVIKIFSFFPEAVEKYYSTGIYPVISIFPDLYSDGFLLVWGIFYMQLFFYIWLFPWFGFLRRAFKRTLHRQYLILCLKRCLSILLWVYIAFNIFWGLNYDRLPIAKQQQLETKPYSKEDLQALVGLLVSKMNEIDSASRAARKNLNTNDSLFKYSVKLIAVLPRQYPQLLYTHPSVKFSFYGYLANYMGFSGYYNPFTCEAQVNTTIPRFVQPFTTCHEIGHQLGYAKEEEANFSGFLSTKSSGDPAFRYSDLCGSLSVFCQCLVCTGFHCVYTLPGVIKSRCSPGSAGSESLL